MGATKLFRRKRYSEQGSTQRGVSLIEALVSLFVFSVGALGLAALQTAAMLTSGDTKQRSLVIWKAQELSDRMRATKHSEDPDGLLAEYAAAIGVDAADIGVDGGAAFQCPAVPARRCADYVDAAGNAQSGQTCDAAQLVEFDVWDVLCEPNSGLSPTILANQDDGDLGIVGVQNLEVAMARNGSDYLLYFEWLSRAADSNEELVSEAATVTTNLCGVDRDIDSQLDAYCVRVR